MTSTLMRTAAPVAAAPSRDAVLLPAATSAPAALVIAVDTWASQDTSALAQAATTIAAAKAVAVSVEDVVRTDAAVLGAAPAAFRARTHVQGPPSRGTPV